MQRFVCYALLAWSLSLICGGVQANEKAISLFSLYINNSNVLSNSSVSAVNTSPSLNVTTGTQANDPLASQSMVAAKRIAPPIPTNDRTNEDIVTKIKLLEGNGTERPNLYQAFLKYKSESERGNFPAMLEYGRLLINIGDGASDAIAYRLFLQASKRGYYPATIWLAWMHENKRAPASTIKEALFYLRAAADKGSAAAQYSLGRAYELGALNLHKNLDYATKYYKLAASQYHPDAITALAQIYEKHVDHYMDINRAVSMYKLGARLNNRNALFILGYMYSNGVNVPKDYVEAVKYYTIASDLGDSRAQNNLGILYLDGNGVNRDPEQACSLFRKSALQENSYAMPNLGRCYQTGSGVKQNIEQSIYWYKRGSDLNNAASHYSLGLTFLSGDGVAQDIEKAVELFIKAAEQGHSDAAWRLGTIYAGDRGHQVDYNKAAEWFRLAVSKGNAAAMNDLAVHILNKHITALAAEVPADMYAKSAKAGNRYAMINIARNLYQGNGVKRDVNKAIEYLREPGSAGILDALVLLGDIYCNPSSGVVVDRSKAIQNYVRAVPNSNDALFKLFQLYSVSPELFSNTELGALTNGLFLAAQSTDKEVMLSAKRGLFVLFENDKLTGFQAEKVFYWLTEMALSGDEYSQFFMISYYFRKNKDNEPAVRAIMRSEPIQTMIKNMSYKQGYFSSYAKVLNFMLDLPLENMSVADTLKAFEEYAINNDGITKILFAYTKADSQPDIVAGLIRSAADGSRGFSTVLICDLINKRLVMPINIDELNMCMSSK